MSGDEKVATEHPVMYLGALSTPYMLPVGEFSCWPGIDDVDWLDVCYSKYRAKNGQLPTLLSLVGSRSVGSQAIFFPSGFTSEILIATPF